MLCARGAAKYLSAFGAFSSFGFFVFFRNRRRQKMTPAMTTAVAAGSARDQQHTDGGVRLPWLKWRPARLYSTPLLRLAYIDSVATSCRWTGSTIPAQGFDPGVQLFYP